MAKEDIFKQEYKKLNKAQKEAVDSIEGPVMVVAGPGTGKTQILALRIGNILLKTDTKADGILCLTFTNASVGAMKERLRKYIGSTGLKVNIFTFHSFGMEIIKEYYHLLDWDTIPKLMDDDETIILYDQILHDNEWQYLRPRADNARYFGDLKSLVSVLKRERISPEYFLKEIEKDIENQKNNPENISSRGENKGQIKKEVLKKIESFERTKEFVKFFQLYEKIKKEKDNILLDYDDILEYLVKIIEISEEAKDEIREKYLYVLVDEHQDSSGVQNEFLQKVWGDTEKPNIFVVGDDRQLIYGFGGASLAYFEGFKHIFGKAKLITLLDNYRSTQVILDSAHVLLQSSLSKEKLISHSSDSFPVRLIEADYPRDEIIACALDIKEKIKNKIEINNCAILVPKNKQVRSAIAILRDMNLPVSSYGALNLFDSEEMQSFLRILKIINNPANQVAFALSFFDKLSNIEPLKAHKFIIGQDNKKFSLLNLGEEKNPTLFNESNPAIKWINKLLQWLKESQNLNVYSLVQKIGDEFLLTSAKDHNTLTLRVEIIRTLLHLVLSQTEKNPKLTLAEFLNFIERLESYNENIPLAVFGGEEGIKVLTLHGSKGLEFDYVWIAHMDERSFNSGKRQGFSLPEGIEMKMENRDENVLKRQLYVAITRARKYCAISYARHSYTGGDQVLADIVADLPEEIFEKQTAVETEKFIFRHNPKMYVAGASIKNGSSDFGLKDLVKVVATEYEKRNVSVSLLNNFFECPWKWYFRNLLQLPEAKTESLEFGNAVHSFIDKILKMGRKPSVKELENLIADKEVRKIVSRWAKNRLPEIKLNHKNEQNVSLKDDRFPHLNIYGKIDLIENLNGKEVRVTDFKTGGVRKKTEIEKIDEEGRMSSYLRQLAMYSYLLEQSPKWKTTVRQSRLEFLEAKDIQESIYERVITAKEIGLLLKDISDYDELIKKGKWIDRPCHYNAYGKNTECEYCKMSEIYKS
jgi:DNA helicase-2/ATP-dependent DNA helicase PcrA